MIAALNGRQWDIKLHVRADSDLLVKQMRGEYRVKSPGLQPLFERRARSRARSATSPSSTSAGSSTRTPTVSPMKRWTKQPRDDLFVVYTDDRDTFGPRSAGLMNRGLAIKATRLLRF